MCVCPTLNTSMFSFNVSSLMGDNVIRTVLYTLLLFCDAHVPPRCGEGVHPVPSTSSWFISRRLMTLSILSLSSPYICTFLLV